MPLFRRSVFILILVVLAAVGATAYQLLPAPEAKPLAPATTAEKAPAKIFVHVAGEVKQAGVVELPEGSRAQDAINACGGFLPNADKQAVNLAQVLKDGAQLRVPAATEQLETDAKAAGKGKPGKGDKVNINTADLQGLQALYGIGPAFAQRILEYRREHGPFQAPEELMQVKGIGPAKYEKLKEQIVL